MLPLSRVCLGGILVGDCRGNAAESVGFDGADVRASRGECAVSRSDLWRLPPVYSYTVIQLYSPGGTAVPSRRVPPHAAPAGLDLGTTVLLAKVPEENRVRVAPCRNPSIAYGVVSNGPSSRARVWRDGPRERGRNAEERSVFASLQDPYEL